MKHCDARIYNILQQLAWHALRSSPQAAERHRPPMTVPRKLPSGAERDVRAYLVPCVYIYHRALR